MSALVVDVVAATVADMKAKGMITDVVATLLIEAGARDRAAVADLAESAQALLKSQGGMWERGMAYISANGAKEMNEAMHKTHCALVRLNWVGGA